MSDLGCDEEYIGENAGCGWIVGFVILLWLAAFYVIAVH